VIRSLRLKGFKSFADETEIRFSEGINCIVGPNGCGKSNIVDALKWIVGLSSAKGMRADSVKDLIFKGTEGRRPLRSAEVSVVISPDGLFSASETEITRRIKANGDSEFLINGRKVRLRDIQEFFMKVGISHRDYAFFEQGQIDRILRMKPADRKALIDEAAGVVPFKEKREETLKQLEEAQKNLENTKGLIEEVAKNLRALKSQAEKAKLFQELKKRERELELKILGSQLKEIRDERNRLEGSVRVLQEDRNSLERETAELQVSIEDLREEAEKLNKEIEETSRELHEVEKSKREFSVKKDFLQKEIDRLREEIEEGEKERERKERKLEELEREVFSLNKEEESLLRKLGGLEKKEREISSFLEEIKRKREEISAKEGALSKKVATLNSQISKIETDVAREEERFKSHKSLLKRVPEELLQIKREKEYYSSLLERRPAERKSSPVQFQK
jgi:chromosome segregation protein